jgi:hypothetical protein
MTKGPLFFDLEVEFEDVKFLRATALTKDVEVEFTIMVQPGTGRFEVSNQIQIRTKLHCFVCFFFRLPKEHQL